MDVKNVDVTKDAVLVSTSRCAQLFGVSRETIRLWVNAGCPKTKKGWFSIADVIAWRLGVVKESEEKPGESLPSKKMRADAEYKLAKAEQEKIKLEVMKGDYVALEDVKFAWAERLTVCRVNMFAWIHTLPPILEGLSRAEIEEELENETRNLWEAYSRDGPFTPKEEAATCE